MFLTLRNEKTLKKMRSKTLKNNLFFFSGRNLIIRSFEIPHSIWKLHKDFKYVLFLNFDKKQKSLRLNGKNHCSKNGCNAVKHPFQINLVQVTWESGRPLTYHSSAAITGLIAAHRLVGGNSPSVNLSKSWPQFCKENRHCLQPKSGCIVSSLS